MTTLTQKQAAYLGISIEGPLNPSITDTKHRDIYGLAAIKGDFYIAFFIVFHVVV